MAFPQALILCLAAGLSWQFTLVLIVVRREQGNPLIVLLALEELLPSQPTPVARDNSLLFASDRGQAWRSGNWLWSTRSLSRFPHVVGAVP